MIFININEDADSIYDFYSENAKRQISKLSCYEAIIAADDDYHYLMRHLGKKIQKNYAKSSLYKLIMMFYYDNNKALSEEVKKADKMRENFWKVCASTEVTFKQEVEDV